MSISDKAHVHKREENQELKRHAGCIKSKDVIRERKIINRVNSPDNSYMATTVNTQITKDQKYYNNNNETSNNSHAI